MQRTTNPSEPVPDANRRRNGRGLIGLGGTCAIALFLCLTAVVAAAPPASSAGQTALATATMRAPTVSTESWAWGAAANLSLRYDFVGAYNGSSSLAGGNLTENGAYVALHESASIGYAVYVVVTAQVASDGSVFVTIHAAEYSAEQIGVAASGSFPAAGTYNASTPIQLKPMNFSLSASVATLTAVSGYLNYTAGRNGSLALVNEHLDVLKGIALSLHASNFPNSTRDTNGNTILKYVSGSIAEDAWVALNFSAAFAPAFLLVQGPVQVGESWLARSTASINGTMAYAADYAASVPGGPTVHWSQAGKSQLSTTAAIAMDCSVIGTQNVLLPNGSRETDYVIEYRVAPGSSNWTVADGLFVLPGGNGTSTSVVAAAVPAQPVRAAAASAAPSASASARSLYSSARGLPDSGRANPSGAGSVTAAPMTPAAANAAMGHLSAPHVDLAGPASYGPAIILVAVIATTVSLIGIGVWHRRQMRRIE